MKIHCKTIKIKIARSWCKKDGSVELECVAQRQIQAHVIIYKDKEHLKLGEEGYFSQQYWEFITWLKHSKSLHISSHVSK